MAVYTPVSAEQVSALLSRYDLGQLQSMKGIAEGVENSNYMLLTDRQPLFLTLYEKRVEPADLPYFFALLNHVADRGVRVPRVIADRENKQLQSVADRPAVLVEFLDGVSLTDPSPEQVHAVGQALGQFHAASRDFPLTRPNALGIGAWRALLERCGAGLDTIDAGLGALVHAELNTLEAAWPVDLPIGTIHADLFMDNVLMQGDAVSGLIDFYFSCTDIRAYDVAVTHAAWCFDASGHSFFAERSKALMTGYNAAFPLSDDERAALPTLARGASMRFLLTRAYDWLNTPADALVQRKDPLAFLRRLQHYAEAGPDAFA